MNNVITTSNPLKVRYIYEQKLNRMWKIHLCFPIVLPFDNHQFIEISHDMMRRGMKLSFLVHHVYRLLGTCEWRANEASNASSSSKQRIQFIDVLMVENLGTTGIHGSKDGSTDDTLNCVQQN